MANLPTEKPVSTSCKRLLEARRRLPIYPMRSEFDRMIESSRVVILVGETGSGKTTQIPQFLAEGLAKQASSLVVGCTQPRRVAAMSVAKRVAEEMGVKLGQEVGYSVRFDECCGSKTVIKYLTDGMLLREAMMDPTLSRYGVVVLDEAHERTVATDILMGLVKSLIKKRDNLRVVVMSATLDAQKFQAYFDAPVLNVPGRQFPVEVVYSPKPEKNYLDAAVRTVLQIHSAGTPGDVLVFLTGEEEVEDACRRIRAGVDGSIRVLPLYSALPPVQQQMVFESWSGRKVVVSTNIAETSLTIDGVGFVVDPGFSKQKIYNPRTRVESLLVAPISRASAEQRAGRAGRVGPGKCYRLYTEQAFRESLEAQSHPEILRCSLGEVVLQLMRYGVDDLVHFDFVDPPAPETLMRALEQLNYLGALDDEGRLTHTGRKMSEFPLDPQLSKMLLASVGLGCLSEVLGLVAMLSVPGVFVRPGDKKDEADRAKKQFAHESGDHLTLLNVFEAYQANKNRPSWAHGNFLSARHLKSAESVRSQLGRIVDRLGRKKGGAKVVGGPRDQQVGRALVAGFFMQAARLQHGSRYLTVKDNQEVRLHPSSVLATKPEWVVYNEFMLTTDHYIRTVTGVKAEWLVEQAPQYFDPGTFSAGETRKALERVTGKRSQAKTPRWE